MVRLCRVSIYISETPETSDVSEWLYREDELQSTGGDQCKSTRLKGG